MPWTRQRSTIVSMQILLQNSRWNERIIGVQYNTCESEFLLNKLDAWQFGEKKSGIVIVRGQKQRAWIILGCPPPRISLCRECRGPRPRSRMSQVWQVWPNTFSFCLKGKNKHRKNKLWSCWIPPELEVLHCRLRYRGAAFRIYWTDNAVRESLATNSCCVNVCSYHIVSFPVYFQSFRFQGAIW
jgi:hypothetical protein